MIRTVLTVSTLALCALAGCARQERPEPAPAQTQTGVGAGAYRLIVSFGGLVTLVPDASTSPPTLHALLGDYTDPSTLTVKQAGGETLAAHQARLYFKAPDDDYTVHGWQVQTVDAATNCSPPVTGRSSPDRFIDLARDDIRLVANLAPPFKVPQRPANLPQVPDQTVKAKSFAWMPDLGAITQQKIHPDLFAGACTRCNTALAARLTTTHGRLQAAGLWRTRDNNNWVIRRWKFADVPQWGVHAMASQLALKMTVASGAVRFESKLFDGTASRWLELPQPQNGRNRRIWLTNGPTDGPPDCPGGPVDFIGHHNLLENPGALAKPPFPSEEVVVNVPPQFDGQCSPAQGPR